MRRAPIHSSEICILNTKPAPPTQSAFKNGKKLKTAKSNLQPAPHFMEKAAKNLKKSIIKKSLNLKRRAPCISTKFFMYNLKLKPPPNLHSKAAKIQNRQIQTGKPPKQARVMYL